MPRVIWLNRPTNHSGYLDLLAAPNYQALVEATRGLPRLPCYRSYRDSPLGRLAAGARRDTESILHRVGHVTR